MVTEKAQRTIRIKWVRSGIAFPYRMKQMIRSLGLKRLNQVVERPDTAQVRGLVARIPHLVAVVQEVPRSIWAGVPEYTIGPPEAKLEPKRRPAPAAEKPLEAAAAGQALAPAKAPAAAPARKHKAEERAAVKPSGTKKAAQAAGAAKAAKTVEAKKKEKREKRAKPSGKGKK